MKCQHKNGGYRVEEIQEGYKVIGYRCVDCDEWLEAERDYGEYDNFISNAVKEGNLDEDTARGMSYQDKQDYFNWSEVKANS